MFTMICCVNDEYSLGDWAIKEDRARFYSLTLKHKVLMGRKTYEALGGKALPKRDNYVFTTVNDMEHSNVTFLHNVSVAITLWKDIVENEEVFVIGGAEIYKQFIPHCRKIYMTCCKKRTQKNAPTFPFHEWVSYGRAHSAEWGNLHIKIEESDNKREIYDYRIYSFNKFKNDI